jgi:hypothetical protein
MCQYGDVAFNGVLDKGYRTYDIMVEKVEG